MTKRVQMVQSLEGIMKVTLTETLDRPEIL
jgi:hypothetical protein